MGAAGELAVISVTYIRSLERVVNVSGGGWSPFSGFLTLRGRTRCAAAPRQREIADPALLDRGQICNDEISNRK